METQDHKPYSRREIVVIIIIVIAAALVLGALNTTTATVQSVSAGPLSISEYAVCTGFGEPLYYNSMDSDLNFSSYQYGHCFFGFWFANGNPLNTTNVIRLPA
jgi:hypothetical protein